MKMCHLSIFPGHNFYGHHGGLAGAHPIVSVGQIECVAGRGIHGDCFFDYEPSYKDQITFFAMEVLEALERELNLASVLAHGEHRAPARAILWSRTRQESGMGER